jgi:hypothetical protein
MSAGLLPKILCGRTVNGRERVNAPSGAAVCSPHPSPTMPDDSRGPNMFKKQRLHGLWDSDQQSGRYPVTLKSETFASYRLARVFVPLPSMGSCPSIPIDLQRAQIILGCL